MNHRSRREDFEALVEAVVVIGNRLREESRDMAAATSEVARGLRVRDHESDS